MQQAHSPLETLVLDSQKAIEVYLDSRQRNALLPFVGRAISISQAAAEQNESANTLLYRVRRWLRLGLIVQAGTQTHAKGCMKLYTCPAQSFFVPFALTTNEDVMAFGQGIYIPIFLDFLLQYAKTGQKLPAGWGFYFAATQEGWQMRPIKSVTDECEPTDDGFPAALLDVVKLKLSPEHAKTLQQDLRAVWQKYQAMHQDSGSEYQVIVGIV